MLSSDSCVRLDIGRLCVSVRSPQPSILAHLRKRYLHFLGDGCTPDFEIDMRYLREMAPAADFLDVPLDLVAEPIRGPMGSTPHAVGHAPGKGAPLSGTDGRAARGAKLGRKPDVRRIGARLIVRRVDFVASLDQATAKGRVVFTELMQTIAVESILRIVFSFLAVEHGGLLLHSAAVARGRHGYVFPGPSETGKSTIASLASRREQILSDEMVLVRKIQDAYQVYSSPFFGTHESAEVNMGISLSAVFLPVKDTRTYMEQTTPGRALTQLLASVLFFDQDLAANERLMSIAADVLNNVPCYDMHFRRDPAFWDCIENLEQKEFTPC